MSVVRGAIEDYEDRHPGPGDVALVIEVTRTSVAKDRKLARVYGPGGIPVYWIVNVPKRQLEVYAHPVPGAQVGRIPPPRILRETEVVDLVIAGQIVGQIPVADLLPRAGKPVTRVALGSIPLNKPQIMAPQALLAPSPLAGEGWGEGDGAPSMA